MKPAVLVSAALGPVLVLTLSLEAAPRSGNSEKHVLKVGDRERTYYLHVPVNLPKDRAVPLVLMFHGGGGTPVYAERESRFDELADRDGFLVAYPEGVGKSWNDGRNVEAIAAQHEKVDDLGFVAALLDDLARRHKLDTRRVFATGISNGGIFSHTLAAQLAARVAAIAPVAGGLAGTLQDRFKPEKPVSVLILQGTADPLVPYNGGDVVAFGSKRGKILSTDETVKKWVEHNQCRREPVKEELPDRDPKDGCAVTRYRYPQGKDGTEVVLYRIEGGGHTWPNGAQYLPEKLIGKVCRDIDGSDVIWEFFKSHPRP